MSTPPDAVVHTCPKCGGIMQMGTIPDWGYGCIRNQFWVEGQMEFGFFGGLKNPQFPIQAFRCEQCGYLELFAVPLPTHQPPGVPSEY